MATIQKKLESSNTIYNADVIAQRLIDLGREVVYGIDRVSEEMPIGKGQCPLCHFFSEEEGTSREIKSPFLILKAVQNISALVVDPVLGNKPLDEGHPAQQEIRAPFRFSETEPRFIRYQRFKNLYKTRKADAEIFPHAQTGGQYLIESLYCPDCFVVEGYGRKGTKDMESLMPAINKPPISLADVEIIGVVAWLQFQESQNLSQVTAVADWEAYFDSRNTETKLAFLLAARTGEIDTIKVLLNRGLNINVSLNGDRTALMFAAEMGHTVVVDLLLSRGADIRDNKSVTLLTIAARGGHTATIEALLNHGADVNAKTLYGETALMMAAFEGQVDTVRLLLTRGADTNAKTSYGETALKSATRNGYAEIVRLLMAAGAKE
jgi:hypothetical protein